MEKPIGKQDGGGIGGGRREGEREGGFHHVLWMDSALNKKMLLAQIRRSVVPPSLLFFVHSFSSFNPSFLPFLLPSFGYFYSLFPLALGSYRE